MQNRSAHSKYPLIEAQIDPFVAELKAAGYAVGTLCTKRAALRRFIHWRRQHKKASSEPNESEVAEFIANACQLGSRHRCLASKALLGFLGHLQRHQVIAPHVAKVAETPVSRLQRRYADFLRNEKGLADLSLAVYLPLVPNLLGYLEKQYGSTSVHRLNAEELRAFLFTQAKGRSSEWVRLLSVSLRSFLRFLHLQGEIPLDLTAAIPFVRRWAQPDIPQKLTPEETDRVLAMPDRTTGKGRRDYAILLLLAKLGLRASEVLLLELGDLRWRSGEILIRGKGGRRDILPLPHDVGSAIARYLRLDRGHRPTARIFLRANAPRVALTGPASIGHVVRQAMSLANVKRPKHIAAHLFRHTLASRMLQAGGCLRDISEVLRHRAASTTEICAKIDLSSLREVTRPWPKQGGAQ